MAENLAQVLGLGRERLLLLVVASNACATFLTSATTAFAHLFALRALSGATVMSILPIAYSVLGDLFPPKTRGAMSTWLVVAMGAGVMLGQLMSGLLGPTVGWRATFVIASFPGFVMSAVAFWFLEMPKRGEVDAAEARRVAEMELANMDGAMEEGGGAGMGETDPLRSGSPVSDGVTTVVGGGGVLHSADDRSDRDSGVYNVFDTASSGGDGSGGGDSNDPHSTNNTTAAAHMTQRELLCTIFQTKSNILLFAQCIPGSVPWGVLFVFMNDFLAQEKGLSVEQATGMISLFGIGAVVGGVLGGILGQKIYNQRPRNISLFMGGLQVFAVPLMWRIIDAEYTTANLHTNIVICLLAGVLASMAGTNVRFLLTNVNSPATRGFVMSIFDVFNNIGKGLGPLIVSWLVQRMGSRRIGYDMAMTAWWLDGAFMAATFFFVEEDERVAMGKGRKRVGGGFRGGRRDS